MITDLKKLRAAGKAETDFEFLFDLPAELFRDSGFEFVNPGRIAGHMSVMKSSVFVDAKISFTLRGECFRCLEKTETYVEADFSEEYLNRESDENYSYKNDLLDLTKGVTDAVLMNLPASLLCGEDCRGLCPGCGVNLNLEKCKCDKD